MHRPLLFNQLMHSWFDCLLCYNQLRGLILTKLIDSKRQFLGVTKFMASNLGAPVPCQPPPIFTQYVNSAITEHSAIARNLYLIHVLEARRDRISICRLQPILFKVFKYFSWYIQILFISYQLAENLGSQIKFRPFVQCYLMTTSLGWVQFWIFSGDY